LRVAQIPAWQSEHEIYFSDADLAQEGNNLIVPDEA
jgi:hypothetical protein